MLTFGRCLCIINESVRWKRGICTVTDMTVSFSLANEDNDRME